MNFEAMPELHSPYGYPIVVGAVLAICVGLYFAFRRARWL
jgi:magnesium transporter